MATDQVKLVSTVIGWAAAVASLANVGIELGKINSAYHDHQLREWQAVVIYSVVEQAGVNGLSFAELRGRYLQASQQLAEFEIPKKDISDQALKFAVVDLLSRHVLSVLPGEKYKVAFEPSFIADDSSQFAALNRKLTDRINFRLNAEGGKITAAQLLEEVSNDVREAPRAMIQSMIRSGIVQGFIAEDAKAKTLVLR